MKLKKILLNNEQIAPQTVAEAVLVKSTASNIETLNKVLERKIEIIEPSLGSGIDATKEGYKIILNHSNKIAPNIQPLALLILHDVNGHIVSTEETKQFKVIVKNLELASYNGSSEVKLQFGDDFDILDNQIKITWNNIENG